MRQKKGFVLLYTLAVMMVVFALTSVLIAVVSTQNLQTKKVVSDFQNRTKVSQIATYFVDLSPSDFIQHFSSLGFEKTMQNNQTILQKNNFEYSMLVGQNGPNSTLLVVQHQKNLIVATVQKVDNNVVAWNYEVRKNQ